MSYRVFGACIAWAVAMNIGAHAFGWPTWVLFLTCFAGGILIGELTKT